MQNITYKKLPFFCFLIFLFLVTFQARAQFPFSESFKNSTATNIQFGGSPTAFLTAGAGLKDGYNDPEGEGYLRLTNNRAEQRAMIWSDLYAFPSVYGMTISFEYYTHTGSSNGADGICFVLFDATVPLVTSGAYGGSLGYAQTSLLNGFSGGYLGVGVDEYGTFATDSEGKIGGAPQIIPNSVVLRGQGSGVTGYPYLTSTQTSIPPYSFNIPGQDRTATDHSKAGFRKVEIVLRPRESGGFFIDVSLEHDNTKSLIINNYEYTTIPPPIVKFAITSSTGGGNNFHEIRNLKLSVNLATLLTPIARPYSFSDCAGLTTTSGDINENNNGGINTLATINRESVDLDQEVPGIQSSKKVEGKGTFIYNRITGKITFTPLNNSVEEPITIDYTFNDSYGKASNVSTITYIPKVDRPSDIVSQKTICPGETYTWPVNGKPYSSSGIYTYINNGCAANEILQLSLNQKVPDIIATGVSICEGGTGSLSATTNNTPSVTFDGTWNPLTDPKTYMPFLTDESVSRCIFNNTKTATYHTITFSVNITGTYTLKMTGFNPDLRAGYIYKGNYILGTCPEDGSWITEGDDYGLITTKIPTLTAHLEVGTLYTLVSLVNAYSSKNTLDYTWTLTPPEGGGFFLNPITAWYTSPNGGSPIGWGDTFNPVGVPNSGLPNTNIAGKTTYYIGDVTECFARIPVVFEIKKDATVDAASSTPETCVNTPIPVITHITDGITGIDSSTNLPAGVTASFRNNTITISGTPTVTGIFNYTINLTKDSNYCGTSAATGKIIVNASLTTPIVTTTNANCSAASTSKIDNYLNSNTYIFDPLGPTVDNAGVITAMKINTEYTLTSTNTTCTSAPSVKFNYSQQLTKPTASITYSASSYSTSEETKVVTLNGQADGKYTATPLGLYIDENTGAIDPRQSLANSYTITYTFTNGACSNKTQTNVQIVSPKIAAWLVMKDANGNGTIEPGENLTFMLRISNIDPDHVTLHNISGSIDLPAHTTLVSQTQSIFTTPSNFSFSTPQYTDFPYLWDLTYQREPAILITVKADCDLTNVSQIETIGRIYIDGVETQTSVPPIPVSNDGKWITVSGNNQYLNPPPLPNCINSGNCLTALPVGSIKTAVLNIDNPTEVCFPNTIDLSTTVNSNSTVGTLTYWIDAEATNPLTNYTSVAVSGTYYIKNTHAQNCEIIKPVIVTINRKPATVITTQNICFGESFPWPVDGETYTASGIYTKTNDGCTADQILELIIGTKPETVITKENICFGESFPWTADGKTYNVSGIYTKTNDGCTADQTLELTIGIKPETIITKENICFGESFPWSVDGKTYTASGIYTKTNDGCTADQTLELTVGTKPETIITKENICFGESFPWSVDGKTYSASGIYTKTNDGCTADQTLELNIGTKPETVITKENICFGESFPWTVNGKTYSASGIYTKTNDGCTADQTLELNIGTKPETIITKENICFGESFPWSVDGKTYSTSGTYTKTNDGCTADQTLELNIGIKPETVITKENICFGESFPWSVDGKTYSTSGIYIKTNDGCTADQTLELTIGTKPKTIITKENICFGESFPWSVDGETYSASGFYTKTNDGCTADQTLELTVGTKPETVITKENICFGEAFPWSVDGKTYSASGTYTKTNDGCTADQTLELTVGTKPETVITKESICFGESFPWSVDGQTYNVSGTYTKTNDGCTADQTLELTIGTKPETIITKENICFGESLPWSVDGKTYSASGIYTKTNDGCTADQTLELNIGTKPETIITKENICFGESFPWTLDGETYNVSGIYTKTNDGCTADQILELTIGTKPEAITTKENICFGESFPWSVDGKTYSASGVYTKTNDGCTADQTLELTIGTKPETVITKENICFGESFPWTVDGKTYSASGTYTKTNDGCTADQILELTIGTKPETIITKENICFGESFPWSVNGQTYSKSGIYNKTNDGCTADQTLELTVAKSLDSKLITSSLIPEFCSGDKDGSFSIEITGGIMPYSVSLDNKKGSYIQITADNNTFTNLEGGSHTIYIKDSSNCTTELTVDMPKAIVINPVANITYSCLDNITVNSVTIDVDPSITDVNDLDYSLDGIIYQSNNLFTNVSPGTQTIYARNSNGCIQQTKEFFIDYVEPLNLTLADGELNEIVASPTGGEGQYRYSFNNEAFSNTNKFIIYKSGDYTITVTDKNRCTVTTTRYFEFIDVCIPNHFTPNGDGINDEWGPGCTTQYKNLTFTIFDRYGRIIGNYKYGQKWDGKYNGTELSSGDYWYVFKLNDNKDNREFVGHFTLYR